MTAHDVLHLDAIALTPEMQALQEQLLTCIQCGSCAGTCPTAWAMDVTPRYLWRLVQAGALDEVLNTRTFWLCASCYSCSVVCPRDLVPSDIMLRLRSLVMAGQGGQAPEPMVAFGQTIAAHHNITGDSPEARLMWSANLSPVPEGLRRKAGAEVLYFVGCVSSLYPASYRIPQAFVQTLDSIGVDFTTLAEEEWCCGYPLINAGRDEEVARFAAHNVSQVFDLGVRLVVLTCPPCYHMWKHVYPEVYPQAREVEVLHATEYLARLIAEGQLEMGEVEITVTYHDPCDLGKKSGVYDAPRYVLTHIPGVKLVEMVRSREASWCCGGGGNLEVSEREVSQDVATRRLRQAQATGAAAIVSACQQCKRTLAGAARANKVRMRVMDVVELVWKAVESRPSSET